MVKREHFYNIFLIELKMIKKIICNSYKAAVPLLSQAIFRTQKVNFSSSPFDGSNKSSNPKTNSPFEVKQKTAGEIATENLGLNKFIVRTYKTTGLGIAGAIGSGLLGMHIPILLVNPLATVLGGGLMTMAALMAVQNIKPTQVKENLFGTNSSILKTVNPFSRIFFYSLGMMSLGLSASPFFAMIHAINPSIIINSIAITSAIFGGASAIAYTLPEGKMLGYGRILTGSLIGLIGMQLVGILSTFIIGPNPLATLLFSVDNYAGILLFTAFIGYDTHVAIKNYQEGKADHLGMSVQLVLDFWNILIRVMQILSKKK